MNIKILRHIIDYKNFDMIREYKDILTKEEWRSLAINLKFPINELREFEKELDIDLYFSWNGSLYTYDSLKEWMKKYKEAERRILVREHTNFYMNLQLGNNK